MWKLGCFKQSQRVESFLSNPFYAALELGSLVPFSMSVIWRSCVPLKVGFFA